MRHWQGDDELLIREFDVAQFAFREWFCSLLGLEDLEMIHQNFQVTAFNYAEQVARFQKLCNDNASTLSSVLDKFFMEMVEPEFGEILSRQVLPTFRSHFAVADTALEEEALEAGYLNASAFLTKHYFDNYRPGIFHRDRDYGLLDGTVNLWIPMTDVAGTNSLWVGSTVKRGLDAIPVSMHHGQCLFFDGAYRWHGAVWNTSPTTRVSFDVRFIPAKHIHRSSDFD